MGEAQDGAEVIQPFEVNEVNRKEGIVTIVLRRDIIGPMANQLKGTSPRRSRHNVLRKLGYTLTSAGNVLYGEDPGKYPELTGAIE